MFIIKFYRIVFVIMSIGILNVSCKRRETASNDILESCLGSENDSSVNGKLDINFTKPSDAIVVTTSTSDIETLVENSPINSTFFFKKGVYRLLRIEPKAGHRFIAEKGVVLNGSKLLKSFDKNTDGYWISSNQTQKASTHGEGWCEDGYEACFYPEALFINNNSLKQVDELSKVSEGKFYFDYGNDKIYFKDNPCGKIVETSVQDHAFKSDATDVVIKGFIVEKYATSAQMAAIHGEEGANWQIDSNEVRFNHGAGISAASNSEITNNFVHHNSQIGIVGGGDDLLVESNEISYNNTDHFSVLWECGGTKFTVTNGLILRDNYSHHNYGPGLWTDIDNLNTLYEGNRVEYNTHAGIFHEISYAATIRNNIVRFNGKDDVWLWGAQILIAASQDVEVYNNTVEVASNYGDGISLIQQERGSGLYGDYLVQNNVIHHNVVKFRGSESSMGGVNDVEDTENPAFEIITNGNNIFHSNEYHFYNGDLFRWMWDTGGIDGEYDFTSFQGIGQETGSTVTEH